LVLTDLFYVLNIQAIKEYFLSTELKGCSTELENVYAQPSHGDGVFVVITGSFTMPNTVKRRFTQSFFLAPQETGGYFVLNDVLSYIRAEPGKGLIFTFRTVHFIPLLTFKYFEQKYLLSRREWALNKGFTRVTMKIIPYKMAVATTHLVKWETGNYVSYA
jgi:hypothetical protein